MKHKRVMNKLRQVYADGREFRVSHALSHLDSNKRGYDLTPIELGHSLRVSPDFKVVRVIPSKYNLWPMRYWVYCGVGN